MRMHYLLPTHLVQLRTGAPAGFSKRLRVEMRTGDTIRWPSFTQYDSAYIEVLLGNEIFWSSTKWTARELNGSSRYWVLHLITEAERTHVNLKVQTPF